MYPIAIVDTSLSLCRQMLARNLNGAAAAASINAARQLFQNISLSLCLLCVCVRIASTVLFLLFLHYFSLIVLDNRVRSTHAVCVRARLWKCENPISRRANRFFLFVLYFFLSNVALLYLLHFSSRLPSTVIPYVNNRRKKSHCFVCRYTSRSPSVSHRHHFHFAHAQGVSAFASECVCMRLCSK